MILDDVFSGLDAETEEQVFSRLLGKQGLFRQLKTTVILTTHAVSRLSYSDHIIVLDTGRIIEQGSYKELFISNGYVQGLDAKIKTQDGSNQTTPEPWITSDVRAPISTGAGDFDTQVDELNRQTGDFQIYKYYIAAIGWRNTSIFLLFCGLYGASLKFTDFLLIYCMSTRHPLLSVAFSDQPSRDQSSCTSREQRESILSWNVRSPFRTFDACFHVWHITLSA